MPFRYTIEELDKFSDYEMLYAICADRQGSITNDYSPLSKRLYALRRKLGRLEKLTKPRKSFAHGFLFPGMLEQRRQLEKEEMTKTDQPRKVTCKLGHGIICPCEDSKKGVR